MNQLQSLIKPQWLQNMAETAAKTPAGCFVEVGVYRGGSAQVLYRLAEQQGRILHLFDTFAGIPCKSEFDRHEVGDFADVNLASLQAAMPNAVFHVGMFPDTLPGPLGDEVQNIAFIHADVDQYESQKAINKHLTPRMVSGGVMMFDDYFLLPGIHKAVDEDFYGAIRIGDQRPYVVVK